VNPYGRLGLPRAINCMGAVTFLGGLPLHDDVIEAMRAAARAKVDLNELERAAGRRIAELTGAEAAFITTGAAAGWGLAAAACIAGTDPARIMHLPAIRDGKREVAIHRKHRSNFDHAIRGTGARLAEFGASRDQTWPWELEDAIGAETAAVAYITDYGVSTVLSLEQVVAIAPARGVPVIVDAAVSLPPLANLRRLPATGADLVSFSGGKAVGGPQNTGFVVGRADLIEACAQNASPNHNTIGRPFKVNCEAIVGLVTALERYAAHDEEAERAAWVETLRTVQHAAGLDDTTSSITSTSYHGMPIPALRIPVPDADGLAVALRAGDPAVWVGTGQGELLVNPHALAPEDAELAGTRIREALHGR
jgi:L-seryl-tRNA(Ser) seleniumtransferase